MPDKGKILVIDDEEIVRTSCNKILTPEGYAVELASGAAKALALLRKDYFDLVLTDLKMPEMDGLDILKAVKENWPDTEVVVITGYGTVATALEAIRYGAYDYLEKPFTPGQLLNVVNRCLERKHLILENIRLKREALELYSMENIVGISRPMQKVFSMIATVAAANTTVLITGESGTGKELIARALHYNSLRKDEPFVVVDCSTIPDNLMESELFGHVKGSFTGAVETHKGLLDTANRGTIFFDEIGNISTVVQSKLLRVIQGKEYRPVGGRSPVKVDIRIIAATNKDLPTMVKETAFREDLFYRLNVFPLHIPALRERKDDIPLLADYFLKKYSDETGKEATHISAEAMRKLLIYDWPGNVRELENTIHRAVILCNGKTLKPEHIVTYEGPMTGAPKTIVELKSIKKSMRTKSVEDIERTFLIDALNRNGWNVTRAAEDVGMQRTNFHSLMKRYRITKKT